MKIYFNLYSPKFCVICKKPTDRYIQYIFRKNQPHAIPIFNEICKSLKTNVIRICQNCYSEKKKRGIVQFSFFLEGSLKNWKH